jgi:hypothetical protein
MTSGAPSLRGVTISSAPARAGPIDRLSLVAVDACGIVFFVVLAREPSRAEW